MSDTSTINRTSSEVKADSQYRALRRQHVITEATQATSGDAGREQGDRAKRALKRGIE